MKKLRGVYVVLVTPFTTDGKVDYDGLSKNVKWLADQGVHGVIPLGSTGEFASLNDEQKRTITQTVIDAVDGRTPHRTAYSVATTDRAARLLLAGVLYGVAGDRRRARAVWREVRQRFPESASHYHARLAEWFLSLRPGMEPDTGPLVDYPYGDAHRETLLFVTALYFRENGAPRTARDLFKRCVDEDGLRRWQAELARKMLDRSR